MSDKNLMELNTKDVDYKAEYEKYKMCFEEAKSRAAEYKERIDNDRYVIRELREDNEKLKKDYSVIVNSRAYKVIKFYYKICDYLIPAGSRRRKCLKALMHPIRALKGQNKEEIVFAGEIKGKTYEDMFESFKYGNRIDIVTTPHTGYIARCLQSMLDKLDIECNVHFGTMDEYENIPYIIVCPQFLKKFPETYVVFQMEQTIDPRWMTEEYFRILRNAYAILDYSFVNIEYFKRDAELAKKIYYLPVDFYGKLRGKPNIEQEKEYDVLFYGSPFIERRKIILDKLGKKFNLKIHSDLFGEDIYKEITKAKVIINIHFYENALLETTRLYETLSVGGPIIVSERSCDPKEEKRLEGIVDFVDVGDVDSLIERVGFWIENETARREKVKANSELLGSRQNAAEYYFYRFLLEKEVINHKQFNEIIGGFTENFEE